MASLIQYEPNDAIPPANAIELGSQADSGRMWSVIANTPYGKLPGKASYSGIRFACWYSYGGTEQETNDFSWIVSSLEKRLVNNHGSYAPPKNALHITGPDNQFEYCIIAKTEWGNIPGRTNTVNAWFPFGGVEHGTNDFYWIVIGAQPVSLVSFDPSDPIPPANSIELGSQGNEYKRLWSVIADTDYGKLPGIQMIYSAKAGHKEGNFSCWYSYDGLEFKADRFSWIVCEYEKRLVNNNGHFDPPSNALMATLLHDKNGPYYSIIANTEWGKIPGRANDREAWFPYQGLEHNTHDFEWIVVDARSNP